MHVPLFSSLRFRKGAFFSLLGITREGSVTRFARVVQESTTYPQKTLLLPTRNSRQLLGVLLICVQIERNPQSKQRQKGGPGESLSNLTYLTKKARNATPSITPPPLFKPHQTSPFFLFLPARFCALLGIRRRPQHQAKMPLQ